MLDHENKFDSRAALADRDTEHGKRRNEHMSSARDKTDLLGHSGHSSRRFPPVEELMKRFLSRDEGSTTIEFVLWLPLLMAVLIVAMDASVLYMRQSNMWQVSRDTARIVSRHGMDEASAEIYARNEATYSNHIPMVDVEMTGQFVTVRMSSNLNEIAPFGVLNFAFNDRLTASISQAMEPR
jgi:hypothetical protein